MPGPISDSNPGPGDRSPYVSHWCCQAGPKVCPCGHHEGFHNDECGCSGLPANCYTPLGRDLADDVEARSKDVGQLA